MAAEATASASRGEGPNLTGRESMQMRHLIHAQQCPPSLDAQPSMFLFLGTWAMQRRRTLSCPGYRWLLLSPPNFLHFASSFHSDPHNHTRHLVRAAPVSPTDRQQQDVASPTLVILTTSLSLSLAICEEHGSSRSWGFMP